ncbi:Na+/H+ antiporter NhaA [Sandarakinorhabdus sp. AAP62]|uniref:Na+/H+ antiporter NhaA n=1 Tax=Sandarakinorhabdus sp. AAP62 TaxID=1248916 RepID=UPI00030FBD4B|nr:Na+/H+ antiporter NhaA [Sandarakinorhabdus sp. AAP62]
MRPPLPRIRFTVIRELLASQASGGQVLMMAAAAAMFAANSVLSEQYFHLLHLPLGPMSLLHWINDGLMAVFFLLVGCEIKREFVDGEMATWPRRILPGVAAAAGMAVPALVFLAFNRAAPGNINGWAIPTATDIAFALGVMALLGNRVPASLKLLLTAIAVIDDLGAIVVIAAVYTEGVDLAALAAAAGLCGLLALLNWRRVQLVWPYLLVGIALWVAVHASGIHATLAGVITALALPIQPSPGVPEIRDSPLLRVEHALAPIVGFAIVPIFGFANAGVDLRDLSLNIAFDPLVLGIGFGLLIGKQAGIFGSIMALVRLNIVDMPANASPRQLWGMTLLCGIGFTMSLFIAALAYGTGSDQEATAKLGIIAGSLASALIGLLVLRR